MRDEVTRFIFRHQNVRGVIVTLEQGFQSLPVLKQRLPKNVATLLGESLAASVLLSRTIKFSGRVALQARGNGPVSLLVAECTDQADVRGIVHQSHLRLGSSDVRKLLGTGYLAITLLPDDGEPYQGVVPLCADKLGECIDAYFAQSEQLPTRVFLAADGTHRATGLLLQVLPAAGTDEPDMAFWDHVQALASTITSQELLELPVAEILHRLFHQEELEIFAPLPVRFACSCNRERSARAIQMLGQEDAYRLLAERDQIEVDCEFCGHNYLYTEADVDAIFGVSGTSSH